MLGHIDKTFIMLHVQSFCFCTHKEKIKKLDRQSEIKNKRINESENRV